jgi:hypothetical protein
MNERIDDCRLPCSSAGACSAPFSFPFIREFFPDSQLYCISDSGIGVMSPDFNSAEYGARSWHIRPPTTSALPAGSTLRYDTTMAMFYNMMLNISGVWCDWVTAMVDGAAGFVNVACGECETPVAFPECP